jgi:hypothetical protein
LSFILVCNVGERLCGLAPWRLCVNHTEVDYRGNLVIAHGQAFEAVYFTQSRKGAKPQMLLCYKKR